VGNDIYGSTLTKNLQNLGIDISGITVDQYTQTGSAVILINSQGENCIVISPGANGQVGKKDVFDSKDRIAGAKILLLQFELPIQTVISAIEIAHQNGVTVILNPAPVAELPREIYPMIDILIPNEREASLLTGIEVNDIASASAAAVQLRSFGIRKVIITLGNKGSLLVMDDVCLHVPGLEVEVVDTTAAGDAYIGALAFAIIKGYSMEDAVQYASFAGALSVTKKGAQTSLPTAEEVNRLYKNLKNANQ
jgi:ribokinase